MKIYETAVRKPISTILIFVGVIVFGLFSLNNLAVDQYPDIEIPQIAVTDQRTSPIAAYGTTVFTCNNHDLFFYNSVMGYMSVANALIYFSAMDNPEETNKRRGRLSEVRSAIGSTDFVKDGL